MNWDRLLGVSLAGEYPLEEILGESESGAWFQTFSEARNSRAVLEAMKEGGPINEHQLACWRRIRLLSHPHLQLLYDCGRTAHHGESLLYAVFENPDESLDGALSQGALSEAERQEVEHSVSNALRYLHLKGLVHGAIDARHIVAIGNFIKITTDTVRPGSPAEAAEDLRALHRTLDFRAATPTPAPVEPVIETLSAPELADEPPITDLPVPAAPASLPPVTAMPVPAAAPVTVASIPTAQVEIEPVTSTPEFAESALAPPKLPPPLSHPLRDREIDPGAGRSHGSARAFWPYAAAAVILVGAVVGITHKPPTESAAAPVVSAPASAVQKPAAPLPGPESRPAVPVGRDAAPAPSTAVAHRSVETPRARAEWRVIAYTYLRIKDAENKVRSINQKTPGLKAEVYTPKGRNQPPFLVALGGRMTRSDAAGLQRRALSRGLPRDTFIRNYTD